MAENMQLYITTQTCQTTLTLPCRMTNPSSLTRMTTAPHMYHHRISQPPPVKAETLRGQDAHQPTRPLRTSQRPTIFCPPLPGMLPSLEHPEYPLLAYLHQANQPLNKTMAMYHRLLWHSLHPNMLDLISIHKPLNFSAMTIQAQHKHRRRESHHHGGSQRQKQT